MNKQGSIKINFVKRYNLFIFLSVVVFVICSNQVKASTDEDAGFSWRANPAQENVVGYKIYYGDSSRFDSSGKLKANFKYDYCVDITKSVICTGSNYSSCRKLSAAELGCKGVSSASPNCTLANLSGKQFFALTAYNAQSESGFTHELININTDFSSMSMIYSLLLEK